MEIYISFNSKKAQIFACQFVTETIRGRIEKDNIILYTFLSPSYIYVLPWPKPIMLVIFYTCVACEHAHASSSSSYGCRIIIGVCSNFSYCSSNLGSNLESISWNPSRVSMRAIFGILGRYSSINHLGLQLIDQREVQFISLLWKLLPKAMNNIGYSRIVIS